MTPATVLPIVPRQPLPPNRAPLEPRGGAVARQDAPKGTLTARGPMGTARTALALALFALLFWQIGASEAREPVPGGLEGEYFDDTGFASPKVSRIDNCVNFDWQRGSPDPLIRPDTFSVRWKGYVKAEHDGPYTFYLDSDDGSKLCIDGKPVLDTAGARGRASGAIVLGRGWHRIKVEFVEIEGHARIALAWSTRAAPRRVIPADHLANDVGSAGDTGSIVGTATDASGRPVAGVRVAVGARWTTTDRAGKYRLPRIPIGKHQLTASARDFAPARRYVPVLPRKTTTVDFSMAPAVRITDWSSTGGTTGNKDDRKDTMYLARKGDTITFAVAANQEVNYQWRVNKVDRHNGSAVFHWRVPREKGIWEIHAVARNVEGEAHHEWVLSTLSREEAPDFFDYFADGKYENREEKDPWGRPLPEWSSWKNKAEEDDCLNRYVRSSGRESALHTPCSIAYGTWKFRHRFPSGGGTRPGGWSSTCLWILFKDAQYGLYYRIGRDGHHYAGLDGNNLNWDDQYLPTDKWTNMLIIRTPDNWVYTYTDGGRDLGMIPEFVGRLKPVKRNQGLRLTLNHYKPTQYPQDWVEFDCLEIYKDKYLFPKALKIAYDQYIDRWRAEGRRYKPVKRKGIIISGQGRVATLQEIAHQLNRPELFSYDPRNKIAVCRSDIVVDTFSSLKMEGETLKMDCRQDGEPQFGIKWGSRLLIRNSTLTTTGKHYFKWRLASSSHFDGFPPRLLFGHGSVRGLAWTGFQSIKIEGSHIRNCGYLFFDSPIELFITDTEFTDMHEVESGDYSAVRSEGRARKEFVRGKKSLWFFVKNYPLHAFSLKGITFRGVGAPQNLTFIVAERNAKLNLYDCDFTDENILVRKSVKMKSMWQVDWPVWYESYLGLYDRA